MKKAGSLLAVVLALSTPSAQAARGWTTIQPSPNLTDQDPKVRLQGGGQPLQKVQVYSYADVNARNFDPFQPDELYAEALLKDIFGELGVKVDYSRYLNNPEQLRLGFVHTARVGRGETDISVFPVMKEQGARLSVSTRQDITPRLRGTMRTDIQPKSVYVEGSAEFQVYSQLAAVLLLYSNRATTKPATWDSTLGIRCSF